MIDRIEASQISEVSGVSKLISSALPKLRLEIAWLMK